MAKDGKQLDGHERGKGRGKETEKDGDTDHEEPVKQLSEAELMLIQRSVGCFNFIFRKCSYDICCREY